jgi:hypothetical protein
MGLDRHELLSDLLIWPAIQPCTVSDGASINTYDASPQKATSIDQWSDGSDEDKYRHRKGLLVIQVASCGSDEDGLVPYLYDDDSAMTTASHAGATLAMTFGTITEAGLYVAEFDMARVWAATSARVVADSTADILRRYLNVRLSNDTGSNAVVAAALVFGKTLGGWPQYDTGQKLDITYAT